MSLAGWMKLEREREREREKKIKETLVKGARGEEASMLSESSMVGG
jgi:hypothetical protein